MPVKERVTFADFENILTHNFNGNESHAGSIIDTKKYNMGIGFMMIIKDDDGSTTKYTMTFEHGDESNLSDATVVGQENLVFGRKTGVFPWQLGNNVPGAASAKLATEGLISTKRYVRAIITTTDWDSTPAAPSSYVIAIKNPDTVPTTQRLG